MKNIILILIITLGSAQAQTQWNGSTNSTGTIYRNGIVGIGPATTIPGFASLFINTGTGLSPSIFLVEGDALPNQKVWTVMAQANRFRILSEADNYGTVQDALIIYRNGVNITTTAFPNGNVGIGTIDTKGYKLAVAGKIISEEVVVKLQASWPDYVFESTNKLMSLQELESFIKKNKHLPEIPSAEEVKEHGHKLGEMDVLLLKKIEELTLYVIELEKRINACEGSKK